MTGERTTPGLGLTAFWDDGSDGWGTQMDANLRTISGVAQIVVKSKDTALPGTPSAGDIYLVRSDDGTNPGKIAIWDGATGSEAWVYITPIVGWMAYVTDLADTYRFESDGWNVFSSGAGGGGGGGGGGAAGDPANYAASTPVANATSWNQASAVAPGTGGAANVTLTADDTKGVFGISVVGSADVQRFENPAKRPTLGADFDHVFNLSLMVPDDTFCFGGIYVEESSTNKVYAIGRFYDGRWWRQYWDDNTFASEDLVTATHGFSNGDSFNGYMRLKRVGTSLFTYISLDGLSWLQIAAETISTHLGDIDRIGLLYNASNQTATTRALVNINGHDDDGPQARAVGAGGGGSSAYDLRFGFAATPGDGVVLETIMVVRGLTLPADLAGSLGQIGTAPTSSFAMSLRVDDVEVATITVATDGGFAFATTGGTSQDIASGTVLTLVAPASADATAANAVVTVAGSAQ